MLHAADLDGDGDLDVVAQQSNSAQFGGELRWYAQTLVVTTSDPEIDCENEGLSVAPGDHLEVVGRGVAR